MIFANCILKLCIYKIMITDYSGFVNIYFLYEAICFVKRVTEINVNSIKLF